MPRLDDAASASLLAAAADPLGPAAAEAVLRLAAGNPLAILELPHGLSTRQLAGTAPLADPLPLPATVEAAFAARVRELSPDGRRAIVLAAAAGTSGIATLADDDAVSRGLAEAEAAGLLRTAPGAIEFRHPLVLAAAYQAATGIERRDAHAALAAALDAKVFADARAWHLAAATAGVDDEVALLLHETADRAGRRGSPWAGARALERAAELTSDGPVRARRLLAAGNAAFLAGQRSHGVGLIERAAELADDPLLRAEVAESSWDVEAQPWALAYRSLVQAAEEVASLQPQLAAEMLAYAFDHAVQARPLHEAGVLAERTWELLGRRHVPGAIGATTAIATWRLIEMRPGEAADIALAALADPVETDDDYGAVSFYAIILMFAGHAAASDALDEFVAMGRERGALPGLCSALCNRAHLRLRAGLLQRAYEDALEAHTIGELVGGWRLLDARIRARGDRGVPRT